jgi:hypothetical protein
MAGRLGSPSSGETSLVLGMHQRRVYLKLIGLSRAQCTGFTNESLLCSINNGGDLNIDTRCAPVTMSCDHLTRHKDWYDKNIRPSPCSYLGTRQSCIVTALLSDQSVDFQPLSYSTNSTVIITSSSTFQHLSITPFYMYSRQAGCTCLTKTD